MFRTKSLHSIYPDFLINMPQRRVTRARVVPRAPVKRATYTAPAAKRRPKAKSSSKSSGGSALGTAIGSALGTALGGPAGGAIGGIVGNAGGRFLSNIFGHGDYAVTNADQIKENNLVLGNAANVPQFGAGKVSVRIKHREFLGDVISSHTAGAFQVFDYAVNPGLVGTFPWLSGVVGSSFQQYRLNGAVFEFRSMSSDALNSTNTALGSVIMAADYDSKDVPFTTKQQMENTEYGVSCKPSVNMCHAIECARTQTSVSELYIRAWGVPSGADIRLYDLCRFSIATVGCQGTDVNLGELWVTYDIDLLKSIEQVPLYIAPYAEYNLLGLSNSSPFGAAGTQVLIEDRIGLTIAGNRCYWPYNIQVGSCWQLYWEVDGASTAIVAPPTETFGNGMTNFSDEIYMPFPVTVTSTKAAVSVVAKYTGGATPNAPPYWNLANGVFPAAAYTYRAMSVKQIAGGYTLPAGV
nr:putative capsid protein [Crucivirus sp.]